MSEDFKRELAAYLAPFVTERRKALFERVLNERTRHAVVVLEDVPDPNDACAVMRSCECFGIQDLHIIARSTPFEVSRGVAVGSAKWITTHIHGEGDGDPRHTTTCLADLKRRGYRIVAVSRGHDAVPISSLDPRQKIALCMGHDRHGLSEETQREADATVCIPAAGFTRGFNVSVCAALCLSHIRRELRTRDIPWQLSGEERLDLYLEWLAKMPKRAREFVTNFLAERGLNRNHLRQQGLSDELMKLIG